MFGNTSRVDSVFVLLCVGLLLLGLVRCTPAQRAALRSGAWTTTDCSLHSSLGCAGQAAGACQLPSVSDSRASWGSYAECIGSVSQGCMVKGLARCAFAGLAATVSGPIVSGSSGCGSEEEAQAVQLCISTEEIGSRREAVEASASCWREICGR